MQLVLISAVATTLDPVFSLPALLAGYAAFRLPRFAAIAVCAIAVVALYTAATEAVAVGSSHLWPEVVAGWLVSAALLSYLGWSFARWRVRRAREKAPGGEGLDAGSALILLLA